MSVLICNIKDYISSFFQRIIVNNKKYLIISPGKDSASIMQRKNGHRSASLTTEAALVFPLFFFAVALFWQLFLLALYELQVSNVITETAIKYSYLGYAERQSEHENVDISWIYQPLLWNSIPENKRVKETFVWCTEEEGAVEVRVRYHFLCDAPWMPDIPLEVEQSFRFYPYLGESDPDRFAAEEKEDVVYRTENGTVYHESKACGYLKVTVRPVSVSEVESMRNTAGEKYTQCLRCDHMELTGQVYVSAGGDRYHRSASCVALKRNVIEVNREEAGNLPACHKCGKQENNK